MLHLFCCYSAIVFYLLQYFILQFLAIQAKTRYPWRLLFLYLGSNFDAVAERRLWIAERRL